MTEKEAKLRKNDEIEASFFMKYTFLFVTPLLMRGYKRRLEENDMYEPLPEHTSQRATKKLTDEWEREKRESLKKGKKPSLALAVRRLFWRPFILTGLILFAEEVLKLTQPVAMGVLISYFRYDSPFTIREACFAAASIGLATFGIAVLHHPYFYGLQKLGLELKVATCGMIVEKGVRLSYGALHRTTIGHMINLLSNDVAKFDTMLLFMHYFWASPLILIAYSFLLWREIGVSSLVGFSALIILVPIQGFFSRQMGKCRRQIAQQADKRVNSTSEVLNGIRVIKMYAWEDAFADVIGQLRGTELSKVRENAIWQSLVMGTFWASGKLVVLFAVISFLLLGNELNAEKIFVAAALYNSCRLPITLFLPFAFQFTFESMVTLSRIQAFLELEEYDQLDHFLMDENFSNGILSKSGTSSEKIPLIRQQPTEIEHNVHDLDDSIAVEMKNFSATWESAEKSSSEECRPVIQNISFILKRGQLIIVAGAIGSGKSSLLLSILRETQRTWGLLRVSGKIAYVSQEAWIFPGTVQENILFGYPFDQQGYDETIRYCALEKDLKQLSMGDQSYVGDRGESLSGGQKARVSFARAVYRDMDIYLLDDPLSAVDTAVGHYLFDECLRGRLLDKAIILVTHQVQHLQSADYILLMRDGEVVASGTYDALRNTQVFVDIIEETEQSYYGRMGESETGTARSLPEGLNSSRTESVVMSASDLSRAGSSPPNTPTTPTSVVSHESALSISDQDICLFKEEERAEGAVSFRFYLLYLKAMAEPLVLMPFLVLFAVGVQAFNNFIDWWLSKWTNAAELATQSLKQGLANNVSHSTYTDHISVGSYSWAISLVTYRNVFAVMVCLLMLFSVLRCMWFRLSQVTASQLLHSRMLQAVLNTRISFFDKNPTGRILNRFSKDVGALDDQLQFVFFDFCQGALNLLGTVVVIVIVNPICLAITAPLLVIFLFLRNFYLATSRDAKRLEATTRSPLFSHISSIMHGLITVRAFSNQGLALAAYHRYQNVNSAAFYLSLLTSRWFAAVIDWLIAAFVTAATFFCLFTPTSLTSGEVALILVYSIQLVGFFSWIMRQSAELQNGMVSVERIIDYCELPSEPTKGTLPPKNWPSSGHLEFHQVSMRYEGTVEPVLKNIEADICPEEKIGIVGRTGAGKSTLLRALFRLTEPDGDILIDKVNTKKIQLKELRKRLSIIPQDPVLFVGTLKKNLDPFDKYVDEKLWFALEQVELKKAVRSLPLGLETHMEEGGANFSVGQRQLICLARALLHRTKVLVIDEATANVDPVTDSLIQHTIKSCFRECTVLTIAHRLHTIMDSDRIMLLENGRIIEFDHPFVLLKKKNSAFSALAAESGKDNVKKLKRYAAAAYRSKFSTHQESATSKTGESSH